ncbi:MAG: class I SAM-dependent methyltransferase [Flavobacteriales bacterium]
MEFENNREAASVRTDPNIFNPRWYYFIQLRKAVERVIATQVKGKNYEKLVDYGCGNTPYKKYFAPHIKEYIGADLGENTNASIQLMPEGKIPLNDSSVNIVLSTQVLEHVDNPSLYLSEAQRILKKDGILVLTTHGYWMYHPDPNDFWRWTSMGLKKIVQEQGFEVVDFYGVIGRSAMGLQLFQDGMVFKLPKFIRPLFFFWMQLQIALFDKTTKQATRNQDACTFIVVAKPKK